MKKISSIRTKSGDLTIYYSENMKYNKFGVYNEFMDEAGKHRTLVMRYADLDSCMVHIWDMRKRSGYDLFKIDSL